MVEYHQKRNHLQIKQKVEDLRQKKTYFDNAQEALKAQLSETRNIL